MNMINFIFGRMVVFTGIGAFVLVAGEVFGNGEFSKFVFWVAYLSTESLILIATLLTGSGSPKSYSQYDSMGKSIKIRDGIPLNPDGTPPWVNPNR